MTCKILTEERWARFLEGTLNTQEKAIIKAHMDTDCPDCEYLLRSINPNQAKYLRFLFNDKVAGREALSGSPDAVIPLDDDYAAVTGDSENVIKIAEPPAMQNNTTSGIDDARPSRKYRAPLWMGGIAALLLITVGFLPQFIASNEQPSPSLNDSGQLQFNKGDVKPLMPIRLQFVTGHLDDKNHYMFSRGVIGRQYSESDSLFLHYDLPDDGYVYLLGYQANKGVELISPAQAAFRSAGSYNLPSNKQEQGISLKGIHGAYAVIGLYSPVPLENLDEILAVIKRAVDPDSGVVDEAALNVINQAVAIDVIHFDVAT